MARKGTGKASLIGLVLAAGGTGSRFGSKIPKQFTELQGQPLYLHALNRFAEFVDQAVIVVPKNWKVIISKQLAVLPYHEKLVLQTGGLKRQESVYRGVLSLTDEMRIILVHDAARPFVSRALISRVIQGVRVRGTCVPTMRLSDTVKQVHGDRILQTLDRDNLRLAQTPQGFKAALLKKALQQALKEGFWGTDESSIVQRVGVEVFVIPGEKGNIKVTWNKDLD